MKCNLTALVFEEEIGSVDSPGDMEEPLNVLENASVTLEESSGGMVEPLNVLENASVTLNESSGGMVEPLEESSGGMMEPLNVLENASVTLEQPSFTNVTSGMCNIKLKLRLKTIFSLRIL